MNKFEVRSNRGSLPPLDRKHNQQVTIIRVLNFFFVFLTEWLLSLSGAEMAEQFVKEKQPIVLDFFSVSCLYLLTYCIQSVSL